MAINETTPANKKAGSKSGKAPHPAKTDDNFGSKTNYADFSKTKVGIGADKKKG